jgi:hypothetical protein
MTSRTPSRFRAARVCPLATTLTVAPDRARRVAIVPPMAPAPKMQNFGDSASDAVFIRFRIVELHPNADPKLFEAVISNGVQQGPVTARFQECSSASLDCDVGIPEYQSLGTVLGQNVAGLVAGKASIEQTLKSNQNQAERAIPSHRSNSSLPF